MKERLRGLRVEKCPSRHRAHHLEQQGVRLISRVICWELECESERWRPSTAARPHESARRRQTESQGRTGISTNVESQAEERQEEVEQTERPEEEWNVMQMQGEEGFWAWTRLKRISHAYPRMRRPKQKLRLP